ncbi:MAG TPA: hypothetical protein VME45_03965 [Stellaceae bacterium]|nr:hypothetical protein [Stellaceae bacterium]
MNTVPTRLCRMAAVASAVLLIGAAETHSVAAKAADGPMPCSAFQRNAGGGWRVLAPVTLDVGNRLYSPMVGTTFPAGASENGIEMSDVLDQQCGNR